MRSCIAAPACLAPRAASLAVLLAGFLVLSPTPARAAPADAGLINVIALTAQRLALSEPVARWKWAHHKPVTDAPRERQLLASVVKQARAAHLDAQFAAQFFRDQIEASKDVQRTLLAQWRQTPPGGTAPDLADTRVQLDRLTRTLLVALEQIQTQRNAPDCPSRLAQSLINWKSITAFDSSRSDALNRALGHVCAAGGVGAIG